MAKSRHDGLVAFRALPPSDVSALRLSPLETFVLSHVGVASDLSQLGGSTGLPAERLEEILVRLVQAGAVAEDPGTKEAVPPQTASPEPEAKDPDPDPEPAALAPDDPAPATLYHERLRGLPIDERIQRARVAQDAELNAWCHDAHPRVIAAILDNPRTGLVEARLIARHHRDAQGLEWLTARAAFAADDVVRREVLRNPQLQAGVIRRLWGQRRLLEQWKWSTSRETTELARRALRETFRSRFATAVAEERVDVIMKTEGRCLLALSGIPVDSKTTALLCARPYASTMLIQNLARWSQAAPSLVTHLLKQPLVRRNPSLRTLLLAHPNAPREPH